MAKSEFLHVPLVASKPEIIESHEHVIHSLSKLHPFELPNIFYMLCAVTHGDERSKSTDCTSDAVNQI